MDQKEEKKITGEEAGQEQSGSMMEALLAEEGLTIDFPQRGEIRKGTIASISDGQILVSVKAKSEGILAGKELDSIDAETLESFNLGDEIMVYIVNPEDSNGNLILSYTRALEEENWQTAEELLESDDSFNTKIEGYNKGGLLVPLGTIRGFVPASQIGLSRRLTITGNSPEDRYSEMVGEEIEVCVIEVDRERRRLILSERAASSETRDSIKERVIDDLKEGEVRTGRVTSLADFGAFVNINGADGLVHLSELSWEHVNHPSEILEVGQEVEVKVISVDSDRKRIGLSIRRLQEDPWDDQIEELTEGQLVEGKITRLTNFGAFARLLIEDVDGDLEGLIHISEISERRIEHPKEILHEGDVVTLRIIKIEGDTHRIGLSMRRVDSPAYTDLDWKTLTENLDVEEISEELTEALAQAEDADQSDQEAEEVIQDEEPETEADVDIETAVEDSVEDTVEEADEADEQNEEPETEADDDSKATVDTVEEADEADEPVEDPETEADDDIETAVEDSVEDTVEEADEADEQDEEPETEADDDIETAVEDAVEDTVEEADEADEPVEDPETEADDDIETAVEDSVGEADEADEPVEELETEADDDSETIVDSVEEADEQTAAEAEEPVPAVEAEADEIEETE